MLFSQMWVFSTVQWTVCWDQACSAAGSEVTKPLDNVLIVIARSICINRGIKQSTWHEYNNALHCEQETHARPSADNDPLIKLCRTQTRVWLDFLCDTCRIITTQPSVISITMSWRKLFSGHANEWFLELGGERFCSLE